MATDIAIVGTNLSLKVSTSLATLVEVSIGGYFHQSQQHGPISSSFLNKSSKLKLYIETK